jgi:hypothetical protein
MAGLSTTWSGGARHASGVDPWSSSRCARGAELAAPFVDGIYVLIIAAELAALLAVSALNVPARYEGMNHWSVDGSDA